MKVWLDKDEKYPDLILHTERQQWSAEVEVPDEIVKKYLEVSGEAQRLEDMIFKLWNESKKVIK